MHYAGSRPSGLVSGVVFNKLDCGRGGNQAGQQRRNGQENTDQAEKLGLLYRLGDGIFGSKTLAAVKYFQRKNGLVVDGIVGTKTAAAMGISLSSSSGGTGSGTTSNSNLYLLACCIYGEARGESYTGKVAIAAVVLNRVKSSSFPNTISGVIYQPGAFTAVSDGQINLGTNDECIRAAQDALNGWDPTYGCIYYYNPQTATNQWIRSRPIVVTIGKHVFCT